MNSVDGLKTRRNGADLVDATHESYRIVVDRAFAGRESDSRLTRFFFETTTVEIQEQTLLNHCATKRLAARFRH